MTGWFFGGTPILGNIHMQLCQGTMPSLTFDRIYGRNLARPSIDRRVLCLSVFFPDGQELSQMHSNCINHDLQWLTVLLYQKKCFPALLYHFWQVSLGVKVHRTTAALALGVQRWWTKAAAQSNSRWSRWNLWLGHVGYTVMLDWICFKEHVYVFI